MIALYVTSLFSHVYKTTKYQVCVWKNSLKIKESEYWYEMLLKTKYRSIKKLIEEKNRINFNVLKDLRS